MDYEAKSAPGAAHRPKRMTSGGATANSRSLESRRCPGAKWKFELAGFRLLATALAVPVRADVAAAACVEGEPWGTICRRVVAVAPLHQREQGRTELASLLAEDGV